MFKKIIATFLIFFGLKSLIKAAGTQAPTHFLQGNNKMNAVATVLAVIFAGLFVWLISVEKRIRKMENDKKEN